MAARAAPAAGPAAMVSVLATEGSAPREAGTRMIVTASGQSGTIGGGRLEHQVIAQARSILAHEPGDWRIQDYPLGPLLGQCCGGRVRLLVERLDPADAGWLEAVRDGDVLLTRLEPSRLARAIVERSGEVPAARGAIPAEVVERVGQVRRPVYLFGAGHVGQAIARTLRPLPFTLAWFDSRPDFAGLPGVTRIDEAALPTCPGDAPAGAAILILTHDHALDYALTAAALRSAAAFVGLIGSATKRARFAARLARDGVDIGRLSCPIGLPGIGGKEPDVIAIAVAAQLLLLGDAGRPTPPPDPNDASRPG